MSLFETKTSDNFIFEELVDPRPQESLQTPFLRKNLAYVTDQQAGNGSYTNGEVVIDSQAISASGNAMDWRNAYLAVPRLAKWDYVMTNAGGAITSSSTGYPQGLVKLALCPKPMCSIESIKLESNGKVIATANNNVSKLVNFKLLTTMNASSLLKDGALIGFYPDSPGQSGDGDIDQYNVGNDPHATVIWSDHVHQENAGLIARQDGWLPMKNTNLMTEDQVRAEWGAWDAGTGSFNTTTTSATPSEVHYVEIIRLRDLFDYFDKSVLTRGVSYRFTIKFNQAVTTIAHSAATSLAEATHACSTVLTSGSCQPIQLCCGIASKVGGITWTNSVASTSTVTSAIDTTAKARFSGVRLYVPSFELSPEFQERVLANPITKKSFIDYSYYCSNQTTAAGASFNHQVSTSCTNPRGLLICPRIAASATLNNNSQLTACSPLTTSPATTDAMLSLTNLQIRMGTNFILPDRLYYGFQAFMEHTRNAFAVNGGESSAITTGLITKQMFDVSHRFYFFDLSRYPDAMTNLPIMISAEGTNNSNVTIDLEYFLLYGRDVEWDFASGSMTITA